MRASTSTTAFQSNVFLSLPFVGIAWLLTVPSVLGNGDFLALVGLCAAFAWVIKASYQNAQPSGSLAQLLHETDHSPARRRSAAAEGRS